MADGLTCIFPACKGLKKQPVKELTDVRISSIEKASIERNDGFYVNVVEKLKADGIPLASHRDCVSTYTSAHHYSRNKKPEEEPEPKRLRRSSKGHIFDFETDCFLCGERCLEKDPKHPNRWKKWYLVRTDIMTNWQPFKDFILKICDIRNDSWSADVKFRVNTAMSDQHAANARYHADCKLLFLHSKYVDIASSSSDTTVVDSGLDYVKLTIKNKKNEKEWWDSVEIFNLYSENGGYLLSRRSLMDKLIRHFGKEVAYLSSPGYASVIVFKKFCHYTLRTVDDDENKNVKQIASTIQKETEKTEKTKYKVQFDIDSIVEGFSETLMQLLSELNIPKLPAIMIGEFNFKSLC